MSNTGKKSVRFIQLLPLIYEKILVDGLIYDDIAKWLSREKGLDMTKALISLYLNRHGDLDAARKRYDAIRQEEQDNWFNGEKAVAGLKRKQKKARVTTTDSQLKKKTIITPTSATLPDKVEDERQLEQKSKEAHTDQEPASIDKKDNNANVVNQSAHLNIGAPPSKNKYHDIESPTKGFTRTKLNYLK